MINDNTPYTFDRVVRLLLAAGFIWVTVTLLNTLSAVLVPFTVALTLAYLLNPLVNFCRSIHQESHSCGFDYLAGLADSPD